MSKEELMQLRYKVIADYPTAVWPVGTIIPNEYHSIKNLSSEMIAFYEKYPHLFKKLEWWEERDEKDMPEYIEWQQGYGTENKICKFKMLQENTISVDNSLMTASMWLPFTKPATKEEYEQYLLLLKQQS